MTYTESLFIYFHFILIANREKKIKALLSFFLLTPPASCHSSEKLFVWMDLVFDPAFICLQKILYTVTNWRDYCIYSLMKSQSKKTLLMYPKLAPFNNMTENWWSFVYCLSRLCLTLLWRISWIQFRIRLSNLTKD